MDQTLGTVVHGLLLQREALSTCVKDLSDKHPSLKRDIAISDDLLQYACGRHAETIEQRRNSLLPKEEYLATRLNSIPPSSTHLFCEDRLAELLKQPPHNPFFHLPSRKPPLVKKPSSSSSSRAHKTSKPFNRSNRARYSKYSEEWRGTSNNTIVPRISQTARTRFSGQPQASKKSTA
nr:unnamed protein product [Callosobruchus chinensis]